MATKKLAGKVAIVTGASKASRGTSLRLRGQNAAGNQFVHWARNLPAAPSRPSKLGGAHDGWGLFQPAASPLFISPDARGR
jgi:hypothetical protein